ncbi:hypothetical protein ACP70R_013723 [Stipagrostis hirtigluma subsp. patula]
MVGSDPAGGGGAPDIYELFCHYNALYFRDSLGACAVCWADDPLPHRDVSTCDYYPGGGGCMILLSKSLYECHNDADLKNVLLHEMIHAYICIKYNNSNHSDHGAKFQKLMNAINSISVADPHRPAGGYNITMLHEIRKKYYHYKCESCGDLVKSIKLRGPSHDDCIESLGANDLCQNSKCHWHRHMKQCSGTYHRVELAPESGEVKCSKLKRHLMATKLNNPSAKVGVPHVHQIQAEKAINMKGKMLLLSSVISLLTKLAVQDWIRLQETTAETVEEAPKRTRTASLKNQECSRQKKRKLSKCGNSYAVIIEWLNYYCVSDSDEEEVPLINKRTERRKRQRLLVISQARDSSNDEKCTSSTSHIINGINDGYVGCCSLDSGDSSKSVTMPALKTEEKLLAGRALDSHGVAGNQAGHEPVPSHMDSPVRREVVDLSDG